MIDWLLTYLIGLPMQFICDIFKNYGISLLFFTLLTKIVLMPLSIKQQKGMARMTAYQPFIQEIQKKWANDRNKQNEELMKFYQENDISPTTGCLPMLVQMPIFMGLYTVIRQPLKFLLRVPADLYNSLMEAVKGIDSVKGLLQGGNVDSAILTAFNNGEQAITSLITEPEWIEKISNFSSEFNIFGIDLTQIPQFAWDLAILIPILSGASMVLSIWIQQKVSGQKMQGSMKIMNFVMSGMFVWMGFTVPTGLSLYWIYSNVLGLFVSLSLKKFYDPEKMKQKLLEEMEAKKKEKKAKKKVIVQDAKGHAVEKDVNQSELDKIRLEKARKLAQERYQLDAAPAKEEGTDKKETK